MVSTLSHRPGPPCLEGVTEKTEEESTMEARLDVTGSELLQKVVTRMITASAPIEDPSVLPEATRNLVKIRASQINGCSVCLDMHAKEAEAAGETWVRLNLVAAWREATVFTEAERAALDLAEQGTRIADAATGVPDDVWANAAKHYDEDQ